MHPFRAPAAHVPRAPLPTQNYSQICLNLSFRMTQCPRGRGIPPCGSGAGAPEKGAVGDLRGGAGIPSPGSLQRGRACGQASSPSAEHWRAVPGPRERTPSSLMTWPENKSHPPLCDNHRLLWLPRRQQRADQGGWVFCVPEIGANEWRGSPESLSLMLQPQRGRRRLITIQLLKHKKPATQLPNQIARQETWQKDKILACQRIQVSPTKWEKERPLGVWNVTYTHRSFWGWKRMHKIFYCAMSRCSGEKRGRCWDCGLEKQVQEISKNSVRQRKWQSWGKYKNTAEGIGVTKMFITGASQGE